MTNNGAARKTGAPVKAARPGGRQPPPRRRLSARRRRAKPWVGAVLAILVAGGLVVAIVVATGSKPASKAGSGLSRGPEGIPVPAGDQLAGINSARYGQPIDGIQCQGMEQLVYHIHTHLAIFVNGQAKLVPYGIGVAPPLQTSGSGGQTFVNAGGCFYWLHTHAADGIIHVESPSHALYTLGEFFDIWDQTLAPGQVGPAVGRVTVYVDEKPYTGDLRAIPLRSHENIQLDVGSPVVPPQRGQVNFSGTQL